MEATAIVFGLTIYCYLLLCWVAFRWLLIWFRYTDTKEGYKEAKKEFKAHCKAKALKRDYKENTNFKHVLLQ